MTSLDSLRALHDAVKAGDFPGIHGAHAAIPKWSSLVLSSFDGSLDAAHALHKAVLPGWGYQVRNHDSEVQNGPAFPIGGEADGNPARAWLLAIIAALIAQEAE